MYFVYNYSYDLVSEFTLYFIQHEQGSCPYNICCLFQDLGIERCGDKELG